MGPGVRVLLFGGSGLLGTALREAASPDAVLLAPSSAEVDVTHAPAVRRAIDAARPDWVLMSAAYTAVDQAESEPDRCRALNVDAVATVAAAARDVGARVLLPSTDYVFHGAPGRPWREDDPTDPQSVYARSKRDAELALEGSGAGALILRVSWLFGGARTNFPRAMWERAVARQDSRVVDDQHGTPTSVVDLSQWCWALMARDARGTLHATNAGATTRFGVAAHVYARAGFPEGVTPVPSSAYPTPATRPLYSVLDGSRLDALLPGQRRSWRDALDAYLASLPAPAR